LENDKCGGPGQEGEIHSAVVTATVTFTVNSTATATATIIVTAETTHGVVAGELRELFNIPPRASGESLEGRREGSLQGVTDQTAQHRVVQKQRPRATERRRGAGC
jgi:hypothetical protein